MRSIGPYEVLANGTRVAMKKYRGTVIGFEKAPNGVIVHRIQVDQIVQRSWGNNWKEVPHDEIINPNYSFVYVL